MGLNAYRVIKIETADRASFSLWHESALMDYLQSLEADAEDVNDQRNNDGVGIIEVKVSILETAIKEVTDLNPATVKAIQSDIAWATRRHQEFIQYDCF